MLLHDSALCCPQEDTSTQPLNLSARSKPVDTSPTHSCFSGHQSSSPRLLKGRVPSPAPTAARNTSLGM